MNSLFNVAWGWKEYFTQYGEDFGGALGQAFDVISLILWIILGIVGAMGAIYAIWLGIQLAKAEDQGKRDEAKKHLITVIIAVAVTLLLIIFFNVLLPAILSAFKGKDWTPDSSDGFINLLRK